MDYRRKRKLTFFTIGLIFLFSGIEYGKFLWPFGLPMKTKKNGRTWTISYITTDSKTVDYCPQ